LGFQRRLGNNGFLFQKNTINPRIVYFQHWEIASKGGLNKEFLAKKRGERAHPERAAP
jgi:hypothetical protein